MNMNHYRHYLFLAHLFITLQYPLSANAIARPPQLPAELMYEDKPIDSLCLYEASTEQQNISLMHCGIKSGKYRPIPKANPQLTRQHYIGYPYRWIADQSTGSPAQAYSYYQYIGTVNHSPIIMTLNNTGGSGEFTGIYTLKRQKNTLQIRAIAVGDRCNGGITGATVQNNQLHYSVNLTSFDLLNLSKKNAKPIKAYDDLAACAVCCEGIATYQVNVDKPTGSPSKQLLHVDLGKALIKPNSDGQGQYQFCFDKHMLSYQKTHGNIMNESQLNGLMKEFINDCINAKNR